MRSSQPIRRPRSPVDPAGAPTVSRRDQLAPPGDLETEPHHQAIANERAMILSARFKALGLERSHQPLSDFFRGLAAHPERIAKGPFYGMETPPVEVRSLMDHTRLYTRSGIPYAAIFHPYARLNVETIKALLDWTSLVGLNVCLDADSEYYPGVTLRVVFYRLNMNWEDLPAENLA